MEGIFVFIRKKFRYNNKKVGKRRNDVFFFLSWASLNISKTKVNNFLCSSFTVVFQKEENGNFTRGVLKNFPERFENVQWSVSESVFLSTEGMWLYFDSDTGIFLKPFQIIVNSSSQKYSLKVTSQIFFDIPVIRY